MLINYDKYSLIINNNRVVINSAAFHYFRSPGAKTWRDRLSKIKACGYNTVDLYFCWGYHSSAPGHYDFTGLKDIRELLNIAAELELFVIARPGPFINAELSLGGLPTWLLNVPDLIIRNKKDGNFVYSEPFMKALKEWYSRIIPIINEYHNIIAFQIENEYFTNEAEPDYLEELYEFSRSLGIKVPIFHNDALSVGLYSDIVNIYAFDNYPTINLEYNWKDFPDIFGVLDSAESNLKDCSPNSPLFIAELQAGWFDRWGGTGYEKIHPKFEEEHINIVTKTALSQGITMFNHYMGCGGTSWGDLACAEVYTSYDFAAPVSETGIPRKNYYKAKQINSFLNSFNLASTDSISDFHAEILPQETEVSSEQTDIFTMLRKDNLNNCEWIFVRNLNKNDVRLRFFDKYYAKIRPFDMKILPVGLKLNACKIDYSSMEIFAKTQNNNEEKIYFLIDKDSEIIVSDFKKHSGDINAAYLENNILRLTDAETLTSVKFTDEDKTTEIIFIKPETTDKTWLINGEVIFGADFLTDNMKTAAIELGKEGIKLPELSDWKTYRCAPEIDINFDYSSWNLLAESEKFDCITNHIYDDYIWYKGSFEHSADSIEISCKHCYAVYLNGNQIYSHDTFGIEHEISENIVFEINKSFINQTGKNELTVLAQNLGFDKGFINELKSPRGILSLKTIPEKEIEWRIRGGLTPVIEEWDIMPEQNLENSSENSSLLWLNAKFSLPDEFENKFAPLTLDLSEAIFNKADIYLNGYKIGKFWKSMGPQSVFYLPEEFLKAKNKISLLIWDRQDFTQHYEEVEYNQLCVNIKIGDIKFFELISIDKFRA